MYINNQKLKYLSYILIFLAIHNTVLSQEQNKQKSLEVHKSNGLLGYPISGITSVVFSALGPAYCFGDVGGSLSQQSYLGIDDWNPKSTRYLLSLGLRHVFPNNWGFKATAYYGNFAGNDKGSRNAERGYSFNSNVVELSLQGERILYGGPYSKQKDPYTLYAFGGVGVINSNANLMDGILSGNRNITAPVVPIGLGYQYKMNGKITLGAEMGWHYVFSDLVDGFSPSGSKSNDVLAILTLTFTYKIHGGLPNEGRCNCEWENRKYRNR